MNASQPTKSRRRLAAAIAIAFGATVIACQIVAGIERVEKVDPSADAAADAGDSSTPDPCHHVFAPPMPAVDDAPNDKLPDFYFAMRHVELVQKNGVPLAGFDLDGVCTCDKRPGTAFEGGVSCKPPGKAACDPDGGIDNQVGDYLRTFTSFIDIDDAVRLNAHIDEGVQTAFVVVSNYNGRANDRDVGVGLFTSEGMRARSPCADAGAGSGGYFPPGWCGEDVWTVSSSTVNATGSKFLPKALGSGYVNNYQLVVQIKGTASIPFASYQLAIGAPISSGRLVPLDERFNPLDTSKTLEPSVVKHWRIEDSLLGGRVPASGMLAAMGTVNTPGADAAAAVPPLCKSSQFPIVKASICDLIDVSSSAALDFSPGVVCDAVSLAVVMRADEAKVGAIVDAPDAGNDCYPTEDGGGPVNGPPGVTYRCP
jgi:hypothetical protein